MPSAIKSGNREKKIGLLLTGPGNYIAHLRPHSELEGKEKRETEGAPAWDSAFIGIEGGTHRWDPPRVSKASLCIGESNLRVRI